MTLNFDYETLQTSERQTVNLNIRVVRLAYRQACISLDKFNSLDYSVKTEMASLLGLEAFELESILGPMTSEEIFESIMS